MGKSAVEGESPVYEYEHKELSMRTSRSEHEKFWLNMGGPSSKAKYELLTDSERVP